MSTVASSSSIVHISMDRLLLAIDTTPWRHFLRHLSSIIPSDTGLQHTTGTNSNHHAGFITQPPSALSGDSSLVSEAFINKFDELLCLEWLDESLWELEVTPAVFTPNLYLPSCIFGLQDIRTQSSDLSTISRQLEMLKHVVFLISNNFETHMLAKHVLILAQDRGNREFLKRLLCSKSSTLQACAEKLFREVLVSCDLEMVEILLGAGVDLSGHGYALFRAFESGRQDIALTLINRGFKITRKSFVDAIYFGKIELFDILADIKRNLFEDIKAQPWTLFEAAILGDLGPIGSITKRERPSDIQYCQSVAMCEALHTRGFDIMATNIFNEGSPLACAFLTGNELLINKLLRLGADIDSRMCAREMPSFPINTRLVYEYTISLPNMRPIHTAILNGSIERFHRVLAKGADLSQPEHCSPIQLAVMKRDIEMVRILLEHQFDPNSVTRDFLGCLPGLIGLSAVHIALELGEEDIFDMLLENGAHFSVFRRCPCISYDETLSQPAIEYGLYYPHHSISCHYEENYSNPLLSATREKNSSLMRKVLNIAIKQYRWWMTPVALKRCLSLLDWSYVSQGLDEDAFPAHAICFAMASICGTHENASIYITTMVKTKKIYPDCALQAFIHASATGNESLIHLFLDNGYWPDEFSDLEVNKRNKFDEPDQNSPLESALENHSKTMRYIMYEFYKKSLYKAHQNTFKQHFRQAFGIAVKCGDLELVQMLATAIGVNHLFYKGWDTRYPVVFRSTHSVQLAIWYKKFVLAHWLLDHGAQSESLDTGYTGLESPLQIAVRYQNMDLIKKLLERGADVNHEPMRYNGITAIQMAAISGRFDILKLLIEAGGDINALPGIVEGRSAIEGAAEFGRLDMVSYLLQLGVDIKGKSNRNYERAVYRAAKHHHWALARMLQSWKAENDEDYDEVSDSVDTIINMLDPRETIMSKGHVYEPVDWYRNTLCWLCVGNTLDEQW